MDNAVSFHLVKFVGGWFCAAIGYRDWFQKEIKAESCVILKKQEGRENNLFLL